MAFGLSMLTANDRRSRMHLPALTKRWKAVSGTSAARRRSTTWRSAGPRHTIRAAGGSYLEVVSLDEEKESPLHGRRGARRRLPSRRDARDRRDRGDPGPPDPLLSLPWAHSGHPSVLEGTEEEIVDSARNLADLEHVHGLDLLAYRYRGNVPQLMRRVCGAVSKPVIMAGSIDREDRGSRSPRRALPASPSAPAALQEAFPAETAGFVAQVRALAGDHHPARSHSTAPRRLAVVAHESRKLTCGHGSCGMAKLWRATA